MGDLENKAEELKGAAKEHIGDARLHGSDRLYVGSYSDAELEAWAAKIMRWARTLDVRMYFDNDTDGVAPHDAVRLCRRLGLAAKHAV